MNNLKHFLSRLTINKVSRVVNVRRTPPWNYREVCTSRCISPLPKADPQIGNPKTSLAHSLFYRFIHSGQGTVSVDAEEDYEKFFSRLVCIMRGKLTEAYPDDEKYVDTMLQHIVVQVITEIVLGFLGHAAGSGLPKCFGEDLWKTVVLVSNMVIKDMKVEIMKSSPQLLELEADQSEVETQAYKNISVAVENDDAQVVSLPKRSGKINYQIYGLGLELSKPKWMEVAEQIHETGGSVWPQEPKPIYGKWKSVTEKILSLQVEDDPSPLIAEWIELLQPSRVDWVALLDRLKEQSDQLYFKVVELLLDEESFQTNIKDYSQLVDAHVKHNQLEAAERIIKKMNEKGIVPDILTKITMVHIKAGNLNLAKEAFESLRSQGFQPDVEVYNSMIMAYVDAGDRKSGESLMRDLESKFKPSEDTYLAFLQSYAQHADPIGASRISIRMEFAGYEPSLESRTCLVEAYSRKGKPDQARKHFDDIIKHGYKPDDTCIARMIAAYMNKNLFKKALQLILQLEKDGIEHGVDTYSVLVDRLGNMQLIDEVKDLFRKDVVEGVSHPLDLHLGLCDTRFRVREEKKALLARERWTKFAMKYMKDYKFSPGAEDLYGLVLLEFFHYKCRH